MLPLPMKSVSTTVLVGPTQWSPQRPLHELPTCPRRPGCTALGPGTPAPLPGVVRALGWTAPPASGQQLLPSFGRPSPGHGPQDFHQNPVSHARPPGRHRRTREDLLEDGVMECADLEAGMGGPQAREGRGVQHSDQGSCRGAIPGRNAVSSRVCFALTRRGNIKKTRLY